jgi:hypothetical protein
MKKVTIKQITVESGGNYNTFISATKIKFYKENDNTQGMSVN